MNEVFYTPTPEELRELARYWATVYLDLRLFYFETGQIACSDLVKEDDASIRLHEIGMVIGEEAVQEVVDQVKRETARGMGPERWAAFCGGEQEDYYAAAEDTHRNVTYLRAKAEDRVTSDRAWEFLTQHPCQFYVDVSGDLWSLTDQSDQEGLLRLQLRTPRGERIFVGAYTLPRPAGWYAPYGL
jgi:hypothetical protein